MRTILLLAAAVAIAGCQQKPLPNVRYSKAGATEEQFNKERYECIQQSKVRVGSAYYNAYGGGASTAVLVDRGTMLSCMAAKGYKVTPDGEFTAPPGAQVRTVN